MEEKNENKPRLTLKLDATKFNLPGSTQVKKHGIVGNKSVTVEVKKSRIIPTKKDGFDKSDEGRKALLNELNLTESELNRRMQVLHTAANQAARKADHEEGEQDLDIALEEISNIQEESESTTDSNIVTTDLNPLNLTAAEIEANEAKSKGEKHHFKKGEKGFEEAEEAEFKSKESLKTPFREDAKGIKLKEDFNRRSNKINVRFIATGEDEEDQPVRKRSLASIRRAREKARRHELENQKKDAEKIVREVTLPAIITVGELANRMAEKSADVIRELMKLGVLVTINQSIDADTAELVILAFGHKVKRVLDSDVENILIEEQDIESSLSQRAPVVTIMGHVDHGKTSLLDALRTTNVVAGEAGGITQHIGAYQVKVNDDHYVTFLDTPGHEAFTAMRSRGAKATDIVVLVVAADDGIMAQTIEAINHAKAANVPVIVAINKIDKPEADPERVRSELLSHNIVSEEFGGDTMVVEVSAKQRINLDKLIETILLQSEVIDLKANFNAPASGVVIESKVDKGRGVLTTLLVQRGTLKVGDIIVAGATYGRVRLMTNEHGKHLDAVIPSMPIEIVGLSESPEAGDKVNVVNTEKQAREISAYRARKQREVRSSIANRTNTLQEIFARSVSEGKVKELPVIIKADVHGSVEAIVNSIQKISNQEVKVRVLHSAVGGITESDTTLAQASNALILGFNVRANASARQAADRGGVDIRYYSIIYNLIDDVKAAVSGMLSPIIREEYIGNAEIRQVFNITKYGKIAGCYVTKGIIKRGAGVRLLRDNIVIHEGKLKTLKRFKEDVKEVRESFECGVQFENYEDIKVGDVVEAFEVVEEAKTL